MNSTIILFSSARRHGNTGRLSDLIAGQLEAPVIALEGKNITAFDYQHRNRDDDFEPLMDEVLLFDNIIFASPVYWYAMTPAMKTFFDRLTDYLDLPDLQDKGRRLRGKTGFVLCTSIHEQPDESFLGVFRKTFAYLGMGYGDCLHMDCSQGYREAGMESAIHEFTQRITNTQ